MNSVLALSMRMPCQIRMVVIALASLLTACDSGSGSEETGSEDAGQDGLADCADGGCDVGAFVPIEVQASDGVSPEWVQVTWTAVDGATGYHVYRDGVRLTETPVAGLQFDDTGAPAGGPPAQVTDLSVVPEDGGAAVYWTALPDNGTPGTSAAYAVSAVDATAEGALSETDLGFRAGHPLLGYEILIDETDPWVDVGRTLPFVDAEADLGSIVFSPSSRMASDGTSTAHVTLTAWYGLRGGVGRTYRVRGVNAAGEGEASALYDDGVPVDLGGTVQWQRSTTAAGDTFVDIPGATSSPFDDTEAPADGSLRQYRVIVTNRGIGSVTSPSDSGFREPSGATAGTLGGACSADSDCPAGTWCSTVDELQRCSPRLFAGLPHELDFVYVPSGTFEQGTPGALDQERPFMATLTRNYFVSRTEVTQGQWVAATGAVNPSCYQDADTPACTRVDDNPEGPIETVDWYSALAYANWLSTEAGLPTCYTLQECEDTEAGWHDGIHEGCTGATFLGLNCSGYRLLTESEWERAARGGTTGANFWGDALDEATVEAFAWLNSNANDQTQPVGQKLPNPYGLFDTAGNAIEWVWDWVYSEDPVDWHPYPAEPTTNYTGPPIGFVIGTRGAGWRDSADEMRAALRNGSDPTGRAPDLTIRLGRTSP